MQGEGADTRKAARQVFGYYGRYWAEVFWLHPRRRDRILGQSNIEGLEHLHAGVASGAGVILALPHMGNWELSGVACFRQGIPIFNIAAEQKNPLTNAFFNKVRSSPGIDSVARGSGDMRAVVRKVKQGGVLCILADSRMRKEVTKNSRNGQGSAGRALTYK